MCPHIFCRGSNEDKIRLKFSLWGCQNVLVETSSRQVMHYNTTQMLHECIYGVTALCGPVGGFEVWSHM